MADIESMGVWGKGEVTKFLFPDELLDSQKEEVRRCRTNRRFAGA
jgi:hypothetical protein